MRRGIGSLFMHVPLGLGILTFIVGVGVDASVSFAQTSESGAPKFFANNDGAYRGGRGLITASGPTGMFLNPTSGTLAKGGISAQVFGSTIKPISDLPTGGQDQFAYYNGLLGYGVTDWLEVGGLIQVVDRSNNADQQTVAAGGGYARVRVLKDQGFFPEVSVGGMFFEGNEMLDRRTLFTALSKRVDISDTGFFRGFRLHVGGRYYWQKDWVGVGVQELDEHWPSEETAPLSATWVRSWNFRNISSSSARFNPGKPVINNSPSRSVCNSVILRASGSAWPCSALASKKP